MRASRTRVERLALVREVQRELADLEWIGDAPRVARMSQDFSWFSPVLKRKLDGKVGDAVARPQNEAQLRAVVSACARRELPLTVRGSGTGNYGQITPLRGGLIVDLGRLDALRWMRDGVACAQAGIRLSELERHAQQEGMELRCMPSTYRSATLGGLFGGGFGGIGSINYGPLAAVGNVLGARVMSVEAEPKVVDLRGSDALACHHLWGTNGIVLELEVALAPAVPWVECLFVFEGEGSFERGLRMADRLAQAPGVNKREVAFLAAPIPDLLTSLSTWLPTGCHAVLALIAPCSLQAAVALAQAYEGTQAYAKTRDEVLASRRTLMEYTWNHTTLHALKADPTLTYLQTAFVPGLHIDQVIALEGLLSGEVLMHVEFLRNVDGAITCSGLPLVRFSTEERLEEIMALHRERDVRVNNPHTYIIEDGKAGGSLPAGALHAKQRFDPHGLLNPGKLRDFPAEIEESA